MAEPLLLRPWEIARLTRRQIHDLYLAKRDKDGRILPVPPPYPSPTDPRSAYLADLAILASLPLPPSEFVRLKSELAAKYEQNQ